MTRRLGFGLPVWVLFLLALPIVASNCSKIYRHTWMEMSIENTGSVPAEIRKNVGGHAYWLVAEAEKTVIRVDTNWGELTELWVGPPFLPIFPKVGNWSTDATRLYLEVDVSFSRDLNVEDEVVIDLHSCFLDVADRRVAPSVAKVKFYSVISDFELVPVDAHRFVLGPNGYSIRLIFQVESSDLPDAVTLELPRFSIGGSNVLLPRIRLTVRREKDYQAMEILF